MASSAGEQEHLGQPDLREISYLTPELATCHSAKHLAQKPPCFQNCLTAPAELAASAYHQSSVLPERKILQQAREHELAV